MVYRWGESPGVSWLVLHVQEIKELLRRWKGGGGLLHCFQTARGEGGGKTKTQAEKTVERKRKKKRQREIRNEEKIGKRAIREGKQ